MKLGGQNNWDLGLCEACGRFVVVVRFKDGLVMTLDPTPMMRRNIEAMVGKEAVEKYGFGPGKGASHECQCRPPFAERVEALYRGEHLVN